MTRFDTFSHVADALAGTVVFVYEGTCFPSNTLTETTLAVILLCS